MEFSSKKTSEAASASYRHGDRFLVDGISLDASDLNETDVRRNPPTAKRHDRSDLKTPVDSINETKAVIASRRNDFFSDMLQSITALPQISSEPFHVNSFDFRAQPLDLHPSSPVIVCKEPFDSSAIFSGVNKRSVQREINESMENKESKSFQAASLFFSSQHENMKHDERRSSRETSVNAQTECDPFVAFPSEDNDEVSGNSSAIVSSLDNSSRSTTFPIGHHHQSLPPVEFSHWRNKVEIIEPVSFEIEDVLATTSNDCVRLEPSPERFWGPQVSLLTFNCLNVNERKICSGSIRQVNSTSCLDVLAGNEDEKEKIEDATRLLPSPGIPSREIRSSVPDCILAVSDSEKSSKTNVKKSSIGEDKSEKSSLSYDFSSNVVIDGSLKKKMTTWSLTTKSLIKRSPGTKQKEMSPTTSEKEPTMISSMTTKSKETWKGKVARTFKHYGSASVLSSPESPRPIRLNERTFELPLELCVHSTQNKNVPLIVEVCTHIIEERGLQNLGIYRIPGNSGSIRLMLEELNQDPRGLCSDSEKWNDVNVVSSLLKHFLRKLPDPLITNALYQSVIDASRMVDSEERLVNLKSRLHELPDVNFETFQFLAQHLKKVTEHETSNKMDAHNLAIIFGPTLIRPRDNNMVSMVSDMNDQCRVIESVINHLDWIFGESDEDALTPKDDENKELLFVSNMSEELLAKAQELTAVDAQIDVICQKEKIKHISRKTHDCNGTKERTQTTDEVIQTEEVRQTTEVVLEIKRYPAYHFNDTASNFMSTENAKPKAKRRTHSNESLKKKTTTTTVADCDSSVKTASANKTKTKSTLSSYASDYNVDRK